MSDINEKVADKIRKLFALSQSPNEAEAASAVAKAHELLKAYNLSMADVGTGESNAADVTSTLYESKGKSEELWKSQLMFTVAKSNYCAMLILKGRGKDWSYKVYGRPANIEVTLSMFDYLASSIRRLSEKAKDIVPNFSHREFRLAAVRRIHERLEELRIAESYDGTCTALVVVSNEAQEALHREHSKTRNRDVKVDHYSESASMGRASADSISLNRQLSSSSSSPRIQ